VKNATRSAIFKWRQTAPELILCAVRWYLRYSLSLRDVEELFAERGLEADHTTVWRWVQRYGPELDQRLRRHLKPTNKSWRVDETYIRVHGRWCYLYRAIDSTGATIDFLLSALRDAAAAKRLFRQALSDPSHPQPRVINTDKAPLWLGDCRSESGRNPAPPLPTSTGAIFEQHPGAGSSSDQTTSEGQAELSRVPSSPANDRGIRGHAHDPEGAGAVGQRR
jgi:transposase-like protein